MGMIYYLLSYEKRRALCLDKMRWDVEFDRFVPQPAERWIGVTLWDDDADGDGLAQLSDRVATWARSVGGEVVVRSEEVDETIADWGSWLHEDVIEPWTPIHEKAPAREPDIPADLRIDAATRYL